VPPQDSLDAKRTKPAEANETRTPEVSEPEVQPNKHQLVAADHAAINANSQPASKKQDSKRPPSPEPVEFLIEDNSSTGQTSMLPADNDGSDDRFKLDPMFDPEPVDEIVGPDSSTNDFDFDIDIDFNSLNIEKIAPAKSPTHKQRLATKPPAAQNAAKTANGKGPAILNLDGKSFPTGKLLVTAAGLSAALLMGVVGYWLFAGGSGFPAAFEARPEVKDYIATADQFRKSERTLLLVSEAYIKSKAPAEAEVDQIQQFNQSVAPLSNKQAKLKEALELFTSFQPEKARSTLVDATQEMSNKIPEMEAKAKNYSQKLR
jgi:hypothetical protein